MNIEEKNIEEIEAEELQESNASNLPTPIDTTSLSAESKRLINQLVVESDTNKVKELTSLFNANQAKKTLARTDKLSDLLDVITDQTLARFTSKPDEISNKELLDSMKIVNDLMEKSQKYNPETDDNLLIQINQQNNNVKVGSSSLNHDSRERVKRTVMDIMSELQNVSDFDEVAEAEVVEKSEEGNK